MVSQQPKITVLVHDVSSNIMGAATTLARGFQKHYPVEVLGPDLGSGISAMYEGAFDYKVVPTPRLYRFPDFIGESRRIGAAIEGDIIVAMKGYADTVPVALREKRLHGKKVLVYLDEWDSAVWRQRSAREKARALLTHLHHPMNDLYFPWVEKMIPGADQVICASTFLASRFRGRIVHQGVDHEHFAPRPADESRELKAILGVGDRKVIVFGGVVRPHKGVECVLEALVRIGDQRFCLLVVGPETEHLGVLMAHGAYRPYVVCAGAKAKEDMPRHLAVADLVVLPQVDSLLGRSQVPCKVFEAMAMAKPVVASAVSDLPRILEGCGRLVPPDDVAAMAEAISDMLAHPAEAGRIGEAGRSKCLEYYTHEVMARELEQVVQSVWEQR